MLIHYRLSTQKYLQLSKGLKYFDFKKVEVISNFTKNDLSFLRSESEQFTLAESIECFTTGLLTSLKKNEHNSLSNDLGPKGDTGILKELLNCFQQPLFLPQHIYFCG